MATPKTPEHLVPVLLLVCAVLGCKQLQSIAKPTVVKSTDGKFQLTVPAGWREDSSLNDQATIRAGNSLLDMYVIVITEDKIDFSDDMNLDQYTTITGEGMTSHLSSPISSPPLPVTINGFAGRQYSLQGETKNVKLAYIITIVETDAHFHQIVTWTLHSRISKNQITLQEIASSFRPTAGPGGFDPAVPPK